MNDDVMQQKKKKQKQIGYVFHWCDWRKPCPICKSNSIEAKLKEKNNG